MRTESVYEFRCLCGKQYQEHWERMFACPQCGRLLQLDWSGAQWPEEGCPVSRESGVEHEPTEV